MQGYSISIKPLNTFLKHVKTAQNESKTEILKYFLQQKVSLALIIMLNNSCKTQ